MIDQGATMASRDDLIAWVREALVANGGRATLIEVARHIWKHHQDDLSRMGDIFFTWQYDMRWAATKLRRMGKMKAADHSPRSIWELAT
jgi:hypothetical protein